MRSALPSRGSTCIPGLRVQRGLTLVELMVAIVIGLILTAGVIQIFLGSNQSYRFQESMSRIQENGRYAVEALARDLRSVAYRGCGGRSLNDMQVTDLTGGPGGGKGGGQGGGDISGDPFGLLADALRGYSHNGGWSPALDAEVAAHNPSPDGEVLRLRSLEYGSNADVSAHQSKGSNLFVDDVSGFEQNQVVIATNCAEAVRFEINNAQTKEGGGQMTVPSNPAFYETYRPLTVHDDLGERYFFIAANDVGRPALFRADSGGPAVELVEGIERLVYEFGVDTNGSGEANAYRNAADVQSNGEWEDVISVRISILVAGAEDNVVDEPQVIAFPPGANPFTAADRRLYQTFTSTVSLRNRLP